MIRDCGPVHARSVSPDDDHLAFQENLYVASIAHYLSRNRVHSSRPHIGYQYV